MVERRRFGTNEKILPVGLGIMVLIVFPSAVLSLLLLAGNFDIAFIIGGGLFFIVWVLLLNLYFALKADIQK